LRSRSVRANSSSMVATASNWASLLAGRGMVGRSGAKERAVTRELQGYDPEASRAEWFVVVGTRTRMR
jgi:hypothetical protein